MKRHQWASWIFLRGLGGVFAIAFLSLWPQALGLFGSRGILPVADFLEWAAQHSGEWARFYFPGFFWVSTSDVAIQWVLGVGLISALLLTAGILAGPALALCWACYLSLVVGGQAFLRYQWDILLLEVGFWSLLVVPWNLSLTRTHVKEPSPIGIWVLRLIVFKLYFLSGAVKLLSGDIHWRTLRALEFHFFTQPLPAPLGYWLSHLPEWSLRLATAGMFAIELIGPFLIFFGRRARWVAFAGFTLLQIGIALTGNYGFFNALAIVLGLTLLEDADLRPFWPPRRHVFWGFIRVYPSGPSLPRQGITTAAAAVFAALNASAVLSTFERYRWIPYSITRLQAATSPFYLVNSYGLFAIMTTERREISVEASRDGRDFRPYTFSHKPNAADDGVAWRPFHMPRLDWQMWFAALGAYEQQPWLPPLARALFRDAPETRALFATTPFAEAPRYLRFRVQTYRFRPPGSTGSGWWQVDKPQVYGPVFGPSG